VARYGQAIIPALLIITSLLGMVGSVRIMFAAVGTLVIASSEIGMNFTVMLGEMALIASIVGWILERERPRRMGSAGEPRARVMTVGAPTLPSLGPVMRKV